MRWCVGTARLRTPALILLGDPACTWHGYDIDFDWLGATKRSPNNDATKCAHPSKQICSQVWRHKKREWRTCYPMCGRPDMCFYVLGALVNLNMKTTSLPKKIRATNLLTTWPKEAARTRIQRASGPRCQMIHIQTQHALSGVLEKNNIMFNKRKSKSKTVISVVKKPHSWWHEPAPSENAPRADQILWQTKPRK